MPYLSLYRKYRSQDFSQIVGQEHITTTLTNAIERDRIAHAYLFSGPRGTGKTSTARIMAKCVNCASGPTPKPCNTCPICTAITADKLFDVIEIDAASNRGIDDVRDLKEKVRVPPAQALKKVYIIDEVHMLTREAFNALLKTLEEPPSHVMFIMATTEPQKLPATILSRCQRFDFRRLTDTEIANHINKLASNENFTIDPGAAARIVKTADGSLRDAISILDQLFSFSSGGITEADADLMFGLVEQSDIIAFMEAVFDGNTAAAFEMFMKFFEAGKSFALFLRLVLELLRDLYMLRQGMPPPRDIYRAEERRIIEDRARRVPRDVLVALMDETARVEDRIRWEVYPRIIVEILIIKMLDLCGSGAHPARIPAPPPAAKKAAPAPPPAEPAAKPAPAAIAGQPEPQPGQKPEPVEHDIPEPDEDEPEAAGPDLEKTWAAVLQHIKKHAMPKYHFVAEARPELTDGNTLTLCYLPEHQFKKETMQEPQSLAMLQEAVKKCFGREMRVRLSIPRPEENNTEPPEPRAEPEPEPRPEPQAASAPRELDLFATVQEVFPKSVEVEKQ